VSETDPSIRPRPPNSLQGCTFEIRAATAAEMIAQLQQWAEAHRIPEDEREEFNGFVESAANLFCSAIPEFIRPVGLTFDPVYTSEQLRQEFGPWERDPAEFEAVDGSRKVPDYDDLSVVDFTEPSVEKMQRVIEYFEQTEGTEWASA
jgi:hypothetical protein